MLDELVEDSDDGVIRDWIVAGRRPAGICAAALLIASRAHGFSKHHQDLTRILRVCGLTVTTRVKEFEQTPSANLTLNFGLRWEAQIQPDPITPKEEVFYAPFIGQTVNGQTFPSNGEIPSDYDMWQPRFGLSWAPGGDGKTVVRLNAGLYYARIPGLSLAVSAMFVLLMSGLILYETSQIVHGGETNYISATVTLYVSIYNLFTSLLHLLMAFGDD